jgi:hypothetical protein
MEGTLTRFIRGCLIAAGYVLVFLGSARAVTSTPFVALHKYYMSPTGSDSNNGTSAATPWATPNHSQIVCGDVIIAAAATTYSPFAITQNPGNCPSSTGGIDGSGGVYFATVLCGGASVGDCQINATSFEAPGALVTVQANNWAVEGWKVSITNCCAAGADGRGYVAWAADTSTTIRHHAAFINDIATGTGQAFQTEEGGTPHNIPGNGFDYVAVVGMIAQNSANWGQCVGAIDVVAPAVWDTNAGTHIYINSNILWHNVSAPCASKFDSEALYGDTWDAHGYNQKAVYSNNISWGAYRSGLKMTDGGDNLTQTTPHISWYNNTVFDNDQNTGSDSANGELQLDGGCCGTVFSYIVTVTNNIAYQPNATSPGGGSSITGAALQDGTWPSVTFGTTGNENIITGSAPSCIQATCNPGGTFDMAADAGNSFGTNFFHENPLFANTANLLSNWMGAPNCSGFANVTACMGWNANTSTLTSLTPIADLVPSSAHSSGKGYQLPSTTCVNSGPIFNDYPTWLKGIVYLHWDGTQLWENADLVSKPCGL